MVDLPTQTLRSREDRYALIVPVRSPAGQRLYTRDRALLRMTHNRLDSVQHGSDVKQPVDGWDWR